MVMRATRPASGSGHPGDELGAVTTRAELGARLTQLRTRSGRSLRDLATAIGSSPSTLSGWCRAENLPFPAQEDTFRAMLVELGVDDPDPWLEALARLRESAGARTRDAVAPYRGLESFGHDDADLFFGREELIAHALERFHEQRRDPARPDVLLLVGASGSGKSSLLHAGVGPRLEAEGHGVVRLVPGEYPHRRLRDALRERTPSPKTGDSGHADEPVLLIDQVEELFTTCEDAAQRDAFLQELAALVDPKAQGPTRPAVLALRIDFYADLVATGHLAAALEEAQILVGPMTRDEVRRAIVEPARQVNIAVDDDLVELLLREFVPSGALATRHDVGALPLLSHTLLETWSRARRGRMTVADYHAAGGLSGAVERSAELAYERCSDPERRLVRQMFLRLIHLDGTNVATRRAASIDELAGVVPDELRTDDGRVLGVRDLLAGFVDARLVTVRASTVEISHETLLAAWPRLRSWIEEDRDALRFQRRITEATRMWLDNGRHPSLLARGLMLDAMREAAARPTSIELTSDERAYLDASLDQAEAERTSEQRRTRRLRMLTVAATVFGLLAGSLALVAAQARTDALTARDEALSRQIALTAERLADNDPSLAAQLTVAGYAVAATPEARSALLDAAVTARAARLLGGPGSTAIATDAAGDLLAVSNAAEAMVQLFVADGGGPASTRAGTLPLGAPEAESYAMALSPDQRLLAVGDTTASVTLWDVSDPAAPEAVGEPLTGPDGPVQGVAFSPDGQELAMVGLGEGAFRWDVSSPGPPTPLPLLPHDEITWSVAYHPDGGLLAVGDDVGRITLWTVDGEPAPLTELATDDRSTLDLAFAPDGRSLAGASRSGGVHAWRLDDPATPAEVDLADATFDSWVNAVAYSPDGALLAAGSSDGDLRVWATDTWQAAQVLRHPAAVTAIGFTDAGGTLVSAATDGTARRWDLATSLHPTLAGRVWGLSFSDDGGRVAAFSGAETGMWTIDDPAAPAPVGVRVPTPADGPSFSGAGAKSPDGRLLAQGTFSGEVVVHDVTVPDAPVLVTDGLAGSEELVEAVAFSPDGTLLAAGGVDTTVRIWRVDELPDPEPAAVLTEATEIVLNLAWSPSGRYLAAPSADNHVYLFDVADLDDPRPLGRLGGFDSEAYGAAFTPDERHLATAGTDGIVRLWDLTDPADPQPVGEPLRGPSGRIFDLDFTPDGQQLAAAVADGRAWVWDTSDLAAPEVRAVLGTGTSPLYTLAFDPSGELLAASGADTRLRLWRLDTSAAIDDICHAIGDPITEREWQLHLRDRPYDPPCVG